MKMLLACLAPLLLLQLPATASAQGLGDLLRKFEQAVKGETTTDRLSRIAAEIDALPVQPASRRPIADLMKELKAVLDLEPKHELAVPTTRKWADKYLDIFLTVLEEPPVSLKPEYMDWLKGLRSSLDDLERLVPYVGAEVGERIASARNAVDSKLSQREQLASSYLNRALRCNTSIQLIGPGNPPLIINSSCPQMTEQEDKSLRAFLTSYYNLNTRDWDRAKRGQAAFDKDMQDRREAQRRAAAEAQAQALEERRKAEAERLEQQRRAAAAAEPTPADVSAVSAQISKVIAQVVQQPSKSAGEACKANFSIPVQHDYCLLSLLNEEPWGQQKFIYRVKATLEVACENPFQLNHPSYAKLKELCNPTTLSRARAILQGNQPQTCLEFTWTVLAGSQSIDRSWIVRPVPTGSIKGIGGELTNFRNKRYLIRQTQIDAELGVLNSLQSMDAGTLLFNLSNPKPAPPTRGLAIVEISSKTKIFNADAIALNRSIAAVGSYTGNDSVTLASGAELPTPVVEAICIEGQR